MDKSLKSKIIICSKELISKYYGDNPKLYNYYIGLYYCKEGNLDFALKHFQDALSKGLNSYLIFYNIGVIYLEKEDFINSEYNFKKSIEINKAFSKSYINLAYLYFKNKDNKYAYRTIKTGMVHCNCDELIMIEKEALRKNVMEVKMVNFIEEARKMFDLMVNIRRDLHMHPEVDRSLDYTSSLVEKYLKEYRIEYKRFKNNGIIAEVGKGDKIIALRGDMDALNVVDLKPVPYRSKIDGVMHACGHDAHTAILVGAAIVLKSLEAKLAGKVRFIFQPAEETDGGAIDMIEYGCLEGVSAIAGLHVDENLNVGTIGVKRGLVCASSNPFKITVSGRGAHGASPEGGIDAILISSKLIDNLQSIISREVSALDSAVLTIGKINGGTAANAIASQVTMEGILRTLGNDLRAFTKERITEIVIETAKMYRGKAEVEFIESYPSFENDDKLYYKFLDILSSLKELNTIEIKKPVMAVEDFAYYSQRVSGIYYKLGCRNDKKGINHPAHGSYFDIDEECLIYGCAAQASFAYNYL